MTEKAKLQIYVSPDEAEHWKNSAAQAGLSLSAWVIMKVHRGTFLMDSLTGLHLKVDTLLVNQETR